MQNKNSFSVSTRNVERFYLIDFFFLKKTVHELLLFARFMFSN